MHHQRTDYILSDEVGVRAGSMLIRLLMRLMNLCGRGVIRDRVDPEGQVKESAA
jgi:hypothetical protein